MTEESTWQIVWSCSRSPLLVTVIPGRRPWVAGLFQTSTPGRSRRTAPWLVGTVACPRLSPPTFPGMTFSLGNHFLWASATTAIFNPEPFMKSCSAHVNKQSRAFAHKDRHHSPGGLWQLRTHAGPRRRELWSREDQCGFSEHRQDRVRASTITTLAASVCWTTVSFNSSVWHNCPPQSVCALTCCLFVIVLVLLNQTAGGALE